MKGFGWKPDLPDIRDYKFAKLNRIVPALPKTVDLRPQMPSVLDQGNLGSCTANAIANCHKFVQKKEDKQNLTQPSRLFIYYSEREIEGTVPFDSGAAIRDGFKVLANKGVCSETDLPYDINRFTEPPSTVCYENALTNIAIEYQRLTNTNLNELKNCLAQGYPFVFGFTVYEGFESRQVEKTGLLNMPTRKEKVLGGHAVLAVGYNERTKRFIIQNSWGTGWGVKGYFTMPYSYLTTTDLADDFWTLRLVK